MIRRPPRPPLFPYTTLSRSPLRRTLEAHLRMYGDPERRPGAGTAAAAAPKPQPPDDPSKSGRRKTSSLVFLDVDAPPAGKPPLTGRGPPPPKLPPQPALEIGRASCRGRG